MWLQSLLTQVSCSQSSAHAVILSVFTAKSFFLFVTKPHHCRSVIYTKLLVGWYSHYVVCVNNSVLS